MEGKRTYYSTQYRLLIIHNNSPPPKKKKKSHDQYQLKFYLEFYMENL